MSTNTIVNLSVLLAMLLWAGFCYLVYHFTGQYEGAGIPIMLGLGFFFIQLTEWISDPPKEKKKTQLL